MKRKQRINQILVKNLKEFNIEVKDNSYLHSGHNEFDGNDETHMLIILKKKNNEKIDRIAVHRKVNNLLKDEFLNGLHSLEINII